MLSEKTRIIGMMLAIIIVISSFMYVVDIPSVTGENNLQSQTMFITPLAVHSFLNQLLQGRLVTAFPWSALSGLIGNTYQLQSFSSYAEMKTFFKSQYDSSAHGNQWYCLEDAAMPSNVGQSSNRKETSSNEGSSVDYSTTNIQVAGVDEPDTIKTDGTYLYLLSNGKIYIIRGYPTEEAEILSEIQWADGIRPSSLFINDNRLVIFGSNYRYMTDIDYEYGWYGGVDSTVIRIYDITDRENPLLQTDIELDGSYVDARMIGGSIYVVAAEYSHQIYYEYDGNETLCIPEIQVNDVTRKIPADQIFYIDEPESIDTMTHVLAIDIASGDFSQKSFLLGSSQNMYVSTENIFLTSQYYKPFVGMAENGVYTTSTQKTMIHKISVHNGDIVYSAQGDVPGHILNQFSMDEHNGYFRIATTTGSLWGGDSQNNVYILDENLNRVSEIENIATGERIYSARFMGDKAYLVTFKKVDPFFTLDLSDPTNPQILGELKIPGYSDYLHPFDENHIIGVGKDTVEALDELKESRGLDFAWYQGIKIAVFDVRDFENPQEMTKIVIGDRGTSSPALSDHKAFLFDREKELLVLPISLYEIDEELKQQNDGYTGNIHGEFKFQGAFVYHLSLENGFEYNGRITHSSGQSDRGYGNSQVTRSLYIGDVLYTFSNTMVKLNDLSSLAELACVNLD